VSDVRRITGWNVYHSTAPDARPVEFIPAEDVPGMTLEAEIALYLEDQERGPDAAADS
jgi:hypothetical protein